jgi:hypothetical protein
MRRGRAGVVLSPALDGGYTLIGLSRPHARLFEDIPWSTSGVHQATVERAAEIGVPVANVPGWYDVDDADALALLQSELAGEPLPFAQAGLRGAAAPCDALVSRGARGTVARTIGAMTPPSSRRELTALAALFGIGCAMLAFVAAAPWIIRTPGLSCRSRLRRLRRDFSPSRRRGCPPRPRRASGSSSCSASRSRCGCCSPSRSRCSRPTSTATSGTAACRPPASIPYAHVPADPALAALRDAAIYPRINRADYALTAYPPLAEMVFFLVTRMAETLTAMRLAMVACEIAIVALLIDLLRRLDLPAVGVAAYAWHPLAIWEIANNGHVEALMVALMLLGVWLLICARPVVGAIAVALAMLVKPYALFILPAFWRRWDWRVPLAVIATILVCYLPYLGAGKGVFGFLGSRLSRRGRADQRRRHLAHALDPDAVRENPGLTAAYVVFAAAIMFGSHCVRRSDPTRHRAKRSRTSSCCSRQVSC